MQHDAELVKEYQHDDLNSSESHEPDRYNGPEQPQPTGNDESKEQEPEIDDEESKPYYKYLSPHKLISECPGDHRDYQIDWLGDDDPGRPTNWSNFKKTYAVVVCSLSATVTAFGSAIGSTAAEALMNEYHIGLTVAQLVTSLYVVGFGCGPILWGPLSEIVGRKPPQVVGIFGLVVFSFATATAKDFQTIAITRFFAGVMSSASFVTSPAVPADMYLSDSRGQAISIVGMTIIAGPMFAPVVGGYIVNSYLGWRWAFYILGIFASLVLTLLVFSLPESYPPRLLCQRAQEIRMKTGNWCVFAPLECMEMDTKLVFERVLLKPLRMLAVEPILLLVSLYHGFIYGILYLCLSAVPIIFTTYGWPGGNIYLPYLAMFTGTFIVIMCNVFYFEGRYARKLKATGKKVLPEERLPVMMMCGIMFTIGIFLLCWSGAYHAFWFVPVLGCAIIGFGLIGIFMAAFNYIIDSYLMLAASAIAGNTFLRSGMGCAFPLFSAQMFHNLGTQWAGTLLGCLAALLAPVPFLFYFYGQRIRQKSLYAIDLEALEVKLTKHSTHTSNPEQ